MKTIVRVFIWTSVFYYLFIVKALFVVKYKNVDEELLPYVNEYNELLKDYCPSKEYNSTSFYSITMVPKMPEDHIGVCYRRVNGYNIEINKEWWDTAKPNDQKQLMFHELAHCLIDKQHVEDPSNYMNSYFVSLNYQDLYDQVILDIYNRCK